MLYIKRRELEACLIMINKVFALCTATTSYCSGVNCRDSRIFSRLCYTRPDIDTPAFQFSQRHLKKLRCCVGLMLNDKSTQHNRRHTQQNRQQNQRFEFFLVIYNQVRYMNDIGLLMLV